MFKAVMPAAQECANPMAILVEALWKAAAAAEAAEAAEPPKRRAGHGRGRGRGGRGGRPRKVMALSEEPEQALFEQPEQAPNPLSEDVQQSNAEIAPAIAPLAQAPSEMAASLMNGGLAGHQSAAPSAANHARLLVSPRARTFVPTLTVMSKF